MSEEKIFADGLFYDKPRENAPDFVKGSISVEVSKFVDFLKKHEKASGYVNLDVKESRGGKLYVELNTYQPNNSKEVDKKFDEIKSDQQAKEEKVEYPEEEIDPENIPF